MKVKKKKLKKAKSKGPKGKKMTRELPFVLTDAEKSARGLEAANLNSDIAELTIQKKITTDEFAGKIKDRTARRNDLLKQIHDGVEDREVECLEVKNFDSNKVEYYFNAEKLFERELTETDKQLEFDEASAAKGKKKAKEKADQADKNPMTDEQKAEEEKKACAGVPGKIPPRGQRQELGHEIDADIGSVMREETSRKTKLSAVDGARA